MNALVTVSKENNPIQTEKVREYVVEFTKFANKSADSVLEMCRVVYKASRELAPIEYESFCVKIHLHKDHSSISKMHRIGQRYDQLSAHKEVLPSAWTTLYQVARLSDQDFEAAIKRQLIHCSMIGKDLKEGVPSLSKKQSGTAKKTDATATTKKASLFAIESGAILEATKLKQFKDMLADLCSEFQCSLIECGV